MLVIHPTDKTTEMLSILYKPVLTLTGSSGRKHLLTPTEEFHLMVCSSGSYKITDRKSIELLFCTEGKASFTDGGDKVVIAKGECYVVAASLQEYQLEVEGNLFIADVPR